MAYNYANQAATVLPADLGGHPKAVSADEFADERFDTRMPASTVNTKIQVIAVAGPTDEDGEAAPTRSGWFLSDFYLFHHLLLPLLANNGTSTSPQWNQLWLTAVSPQKLVDNYTEYRHGDTHDCRIVLDQSMVADASKGVSVVSPKDLRQNFLDSVAKICEICHAQARPVLIMMLGHGKAKNGGVYIGENPRNRLVLIEDLQKAIGKHKNMTTVYITACFSGKWSINQAFGPSTMTAANPTDESLSHPADHTGACPGSRFTTAMLKTLMKTESYDVKKSNYSNLTFAALVDVLGQTLENEVIIGSDCTTSFAAREDGWADSWWGQSSFPLLGIPTPTSGAPTFKDRWEALTPVVPPVDATADVLAHTVVRTLHPSQASSPLQVQAKEYLDSKPGSPSFSGNQGPATLCQLVLSGAGVPPATLQFLSGILDYRLGRIMKPATDYKNKLELKDGFPDCQNFDAYEYTREHAKDKAKIDRYSHIFDLVANFELFPDPSESDGPDYAKGIAYLAAALTEKGWTDDQVRVGLQALKENKLMAVVPALKRSYRLSPGYPLTGL